jgi:hypothetical protein
MRLEGPTEPLFTLSHRLASPCVLAENWTGYPEKCSFNRRDI